MRKNQKEARKLRAIALLANPGATQGKVAKTLGISRATLVRDLASIDQAQLAADLAEYRKTCMAVVPIPQRVDLLAKWAGQDSDGSTALRALERLDKLSGIHAEPAKQEHQGEPVPLFSLPAGTRVAIQLGPPTGPPERDSSK